MIGRTSIVSAAVALALAGSGCSDAGGGAVAANGDRTAKATTGTVAPAGVTPAKAADAAPCLTYGRWRTTLTADGPAYPLPRFDAAAERRCVTVFRDNRTDVITLLPPGRLPEKLGLAPVFGQVPDANSLGPDGTTGTGLIIIYATTALGGQANADAMTEALNRRTVATEDAIGTTARWRGIAISGDVAPDVLRAALDSLDGRWRPLASTDAADRIAAATQEAANWHRYPDGRHLLGEADGRYRDGPSVEGGGQERTFVEFAKTGSDIVAYVFADESDNVGCYAGRLAGDGKLTALRFTDPLFGGEDGGDPVQSVASIYPDQLFRTTMRPVPAGYRPVALPKDEDGVALCRQAFAKPGSTGGPGAGKAQGDKAR